MAVGREMANHDNQDRGGFIDPSAIRFCGEEIGEACPPMLEASAIAIYEVSRFSSSSGQDGRTMRHLEKTDFGCNSLVIGLIRVSCIVR